eukprot:9454761-Pyramimonas_sp.AAC.2
MAQPSAPAFTPNCEGQLAMHSTLPTQPPMPMGFSCEGVPRIQLEMALQDAVSRIQDQCLGFSSPMCWESR